MIAKCLKHLLLAFGLLFSIAASADSLKSLFHHEQDPVAGNPKGSITVVEFFDYQCSHCVNMSPVISAIIKGNPNVRVVFKEYPIRGPMSELAARAALAANKQGKYYQFNHALMSSNMFINENNIMDIAKSVGLNIKKLQADMKSSAVTNEIQANYQLARELNITGTPAFFIGKTNEKQSKNLDFNLGEMSQKELQNAINQAGA